LLRDEALVTVCEEARCPNLGECFSNGTATFMLLGDRCTRRCGYCAVATKKPAPVDPGEPDRVAEAAKRMRLSHVVLTSVARDDLRDAGASHFVRAIEALRARIPGVDVEVLTPDFRGGDDAIATVCEARPEVFNHNIETVARLFPRLRAQGGYERSLRFLARIKELAPRQITKSGLMVGLGESDEEVVATLEDLRGVAVDIVTIGQYLRPSREHVPVSRYVTPEAFDAFGAVARELGFRAVHSGVFVRSSFHAAEVAAACRS
jgi:lipoic acid synthetase